MEEILSYVEETKRKRSSKHMIILKCEGEIDNKRQ
jgi:hypothetical protein